MAKPKKKKVVKKKSLPSKDFLVSIKYDHNTIVDAAAPELYQAILQLGHVTPERIKTKVAFTVTFEGKIAQRSFPPLRLVRAFKYEDDARMLAKTLTILLK